MAASLASFGRRLSISPWIHDSRLAIRARGYAPLMKSSLRSQGRSVLVSGRHECQTRALAAQAQPAVVDHSWDSMGETTIPSLDKFSGRHIGPEESEVNAMLKDLDPPVPSLDKLVAEVIPSDVLSKNPEKFHIGRQEHGSPESSVMSQGADMAAKNIIAMSCIGQGYYGTFTPEVIKRNILENPAWYTSYTPYQPEISQGRLESLLNFQTVVSDLTGLTISNASLLDEGTAAAEAMTLSVNSLPSSRAKEKRKTFVVSDGVNRQTIAVLRGRAEGFGVDVVVEDVMRPDIEERLKDLGGSLVGVMVQYPDVEGHVRDYERLADLVHAQGGLLSAATDLLALTVLKPPGEWGTDIAFGNSQRFGVPMGYGGPHAAFFAVREKHKRKIPGRLVGVSKDRLGNRALRLALQTREQHIRREKATSNVCTAQALLANMAAMYAVYHGPEGLKTIAKRVMWNAQYLQEVARVSGLGVADSAPGFDTVILRLPEVARLVVEEAASLPKPITFRALDDSRIAVTVDETMSLEELIRIVMVLTTASKKIQDARSGGPQSSLFYKGHQIKRTFSELETRPVDMGPLERKSAYLTHPVFNTHHSETELLRYIYHLQSKDLSLVHSMIPLGSCTMKLNGGAEMSLISLPGFANIHPCAPESHTRGYALLVRALSTQLQTITAMDGVSLQPNSGAQGEFAGLRVIRQFHKANGQPARDICLIPVSAHGTNPASAAMAGMRVVPIKCDTKTGNLDLADLEAKCKENEKELAAIMITYPSTFGVFEPQIKRVCDIVHEHGGQVYMDGANMNAQIGLCSPGEIGADVCHLNLHKTFCIPHGGGGPGVGPICVKRHLIEYLPTMAYGTDRDAHPPVSSAPYGSAGILPISWAYNTLMGSEGLRRATKVTLLNANYLLSRLRPHYPILYTNEHGRCAHEFILDARPFRESAGVEAIDIAKRLQDYGFHAPTMSWPVANTLMIEPTESESKEELDRFVAALVSIREEIREVEEGRQPREGNVLKMAPHPLRDIIEGDGEAGAAWDRPYSREKAAFPLPWLKEKKFWPSVARVDDTYGDLNLFCTCPPVEDTTGRSSGNLSSTQGSVEDETA